MVDGPAVPPIRVCLERNAQCFKGSIQLTGRTKPPRHLIGMSEELASGNESANSGRTLMAGSDNRFVWASIAHIHGIPGIPEWAGWFADELNTRRAMTRALGIGCDPVIVKGEKELFLDWLSRGVESGVWSDRSPGRNRFDPLAEPETWRPLPGGTTSDCSSFPTHTTYSLSEYRDHLR